MPGADGPHFNQSAYTHALRAANVFDDSASEFGGVSSSGEERGCRGFVRYFCQLANPIGRPGALTARCGCRRLGVTQQHSWRAPSGLDPEPRALGLRATTAGGAPLVTFSSTSVINDLGNYQIEAHVLKNILLLLYCIYRLAVYMNVDILTVDTMSGFNLESSRLEFAEAEVKIKFGFRIISKRPMDRPIRTTWAMQQHRQGGSK
ncbi:hypothetical protein PCH_Pc13g08930 [Penicillium rubens Wisconsin 54-1255]|uniref:Uncharacterized protein n=1 Tax=Penicillium rubens (strain ATCC 28089 / DSM 1075 / NRRL 1951 / Wisconsin 54-1255) TaxID=500485 RepID=B6H4J3_PENRW|nr:hypothetical protein PCH_Pc13g08930 [Penicillium rubens Wisconsin 54-1255]